MTDDIKLLKNMIDESNGIVFFSSVGVSTESGWKDLISKDGIYNIKLKYDEPPEYMLSRTCFYNDTEMFYDFYKKYMNCTHAEPNITHKYLKKLEDKGKLKAIVTQNIDGLHTKAGNKNVYELHGTIYKNHCIKCNKEYDAEYVFNSKGIPKCKKCGGTIKPDVVLYGEMLPEDACNNALYDIAHTDTLIIAGSSLTVYPASGMIRYFKGKNLVIINRDKPDYDSMATLVIHDELKNVFEKLK